MIKVIEDFLPEDTQNNLEELMKNEVYFPWFFNSKTAGNSINKKKSILLRSSRKINKNKYKSELSGSTSWYGPNFHGKLTANGEVYDMYGITAAHKSLPLNTIARVTNLDNGKSIILRINDRGPYIDNRILDCSFGAAKKLGFVGDGTAPVKIEIMEWGDGEYMHHD